MTNQDMGTGEDQTRPARELIDAARRQVEEARDRKEELVSPELTRASPEAGPEFAAPPPDSFTGYKIVREIHRGGQGVVYQAIQESTKRKVAIKVMKEGPFADSVDRARFDREVQVLGQLNHPNIVSVHDTGTAAGHFYFVMDYISGQPLDIHMAGGDFELVGGFWAITGVTPPGCVGDLNGDGRTDLADLGILLADFGCTPPPNCVGDLDGDGDTDLADLGILLADFGCAP
jgi:hypothetical protein